MKKFTLLELLIVISIIGILLTMLLPSLKKAREAGMLAICVSNISQISKATWAYTVQNSSRFMPTDPPEAGGSWDDYLLDGYIGEIPVEDRESRFPQYDPIFEFFKCPMDYIDSKQPKEAESFFRGNVSYRRSYSLNGVSNGTNAATYSSKIFGDPSANLPPYFTGQLDSPGETIFATENPRHENNVGNKTNGRVSALRDLSKVDVYDKDIDGKTYTWGIDKSIHNKGFRYPFGFMDGAVKVTNAEETRKNSNYLWLGKKPQ